MGYDLHIHRRDAWYDDAGPAITLSEWLAYVESDPELRHDGFAETRTPQGQVLRLERPGIAVWLGHPLAAEASVWLRWGSGRITAKNPDLETRRKLYAIAQALQAKLQGDELEVYGSDGEPLHSAEVDEVVEHRPPEGPRRPWWKLI